MSYYAFPRAQRAGSLGQPVKPEPERKQAARRLTETQKAEIVERVAAGQSDADIAFSMGIGRDQVYRLRKQKEKDNE